MKTKEVSPGQLYIVTGTVDGVVTCEEYGQLRSFSAGEQEWVVIPDGVTQVTISDADAAFSPLR